LFKLNLKKNIYKIIKNKRINLDLYFKLNVFLIRFIEYLIGKKVFIKFDFYILKLLNFIEITQCRIWSKKLKYYRKILGPNLYLNESLQILYLSLKLKDPNIFINWMVIILKKINFWKHRLFFYYIKYILRYFFFEVYNKINIKGVKMQWKGKISVAGNARTRTMRLKIGHGGSSELLNKTAFELNLIKTFTGVIGLKFWIYY